MFYISLPFFYENYQFNQFFKEYVTMSRQLKHSKLIADFNIEYSYGAFPWSYWNGGYNTHTGKAVLTTEMKNFFNKLSIPARIDFSNVNLQASDYLDIQGNAIIRTANGMNITYEISIIDFMDYLSNNNLNNKYIISNNAQIIHPFDEDILNAFIQKDSIDLINIGHGLNFDLSLIENKNKIEISIGYCGHCSLNKQLQCSYNEQQNIYNYSGESMYLNCPCENKIVNYYQELINFYKQGIKHFKITTNSSDLNTFNINIIKSFIKPEYWGECINEYYKTIISK